MDPEGPTSRARRATPRRILCADRPSRMAVYLVFVAAACRCGDGADSPHDNPGGGALQVRDGGGHLGEGGGSSAGDSSAGRSGGGDSSAGGSSAGGSSAAGSSAGRSAGGGSSAGDSSAGRSGGGDSSASGSAGSDRAGTASEGEGGRGPGADGAVTEPPPSVDCRKKGDGKTTVTLVNHCSERLEARGSNWGGKTLEAGAFVCLDIGTDVEPLSALRYWGFLGADPGAERHTLAEFTLNTSFHDFDWYDISHVDAHNLPMQIVPFGMPDCRTLTCANSLLANCPDVGKLRDATGTLVSCVSPDRNNATSPVATYFDQACADAYSWSGDDAQSMVACAGEDFDVVFCP